MTSLRWERPHVLWCASARLNIRKLTEPRMLCSAADPREVAHWAAANRSWASVLPLVLFGGDELAVSRSVPFNQPQGDGVPWRVENAHPDVHATLRALADSPLSGGERTSIDRYLTAVSLVIAYAPRPTWWVMSEADEGMGAVRTAKDHGASVALASLGQDMGLMGVSLANRLNVDVAIHDASTHGVA